MKTWKIILLASLLWLCTAAAASAQKKEPLRTVTFDTNLVCENCKKKIENAIPFERGVKDLIVDVPTKQVTVTFDPAKTDTLTLEKAFAKIQIEAAVAPADQRHP